MSNSTSTLSRLPAWLVQEIPGSQVSERLKVLSGLGLHTVCSEAKCPNINRCLRNNEITFLILGETCTRNCRFCNIEQRPPAERSNFDQGEPLRIREAVNRLNLDYVVITSVTRDDLADGGANSFSQVIRILHEMNRQIKVEVLIPDFGGVASSLRVVIDASPEVLAHNLETVRRLYPLLRPQADYDRSLSLLSKVKQRPSKTRSKSSLMLGLGEQSGEVFEAIRDLRKCGCDYLTLGQYLAPNKRHYPVSEYINPEDFLKYRRYALDIGFRGVAASPVTRSSYRAKELYYNDYRDYQNSIQD